jgi:hypothetical protein
VGLVASSEPVDGVGQFEEADEPASTPDETEEEKERDDVREYVQVQQLYENAVVTNMERGEKRASSEYTIQQKGEFHSIMEPEAVSVRSNGGSRSFVTQHGMYLRPWLMCNVTVKK